MKEISRGAHALVAFAALSALAALDALAQTPINLPPLNGFQPLVIFGLTDEQVGGDDFLDINSFLTHASTTPGANGVPSNTLPLGGAQKYFVAIVDTGAQASILSYESAQQANLDSAGRTGGNSIEIVGASGSEFVDIADPIGIYMTHLGRGQVNAGNLSILPSTSLKGMWNNSMLVTDSDSVLPNIIGSPVVGLYQTIIKNSQPTHITVGSTTYKSPLVDFAPINTEIPSSYGRIALTRTNNVGGPPAFTPSFNDFDNVADDPASPTIGESLFATITVSHTDGSSQNSFMFDTGAQVSVLSRDTAGAVGIYTTGDNATPPDFFTDILGVGGEIQQAPGYYVNSMLITSTSGPLRYNQVPVIVLDLPDPRDLGVILPGIIGTNLFTARDLIINIDATGAAKTGLYVSAPWAWKFNGNGNWSEAAKWNIVTPNGIDTQANFFSAIQADRTVTVDGAGFTVGSVAFDNTNRYTLNGPGAITLDVSVGNAQVNVHSGSHTINAAMNFTDDTEINVLPAASVLTLNGTVTSPAVKIIKAGNGMVEMKNVRAAGLELTDGTLRVLSNGTSAATSQVNTIAATKGKLDLRNNDLVVKTTPIGSWDSFNSVYTGVTGLIQSGRNQGDWDGRGIISSQALADIAGGPTGAEYTSLGAIRNGDLAVNGFVPYTSFSGMPVNNDAVLVKYTYAGDATLDGTINADDYTQIDTGFAFASSGWINGDFNYDGLIDGNDYTLIDTNFAFQGGVLGPAMGVATVPEPATAALLAMGALTALGRKRRS